MTRSHLTNTHNKDGMLAQSRFFCTPSTSSSSSSHRTQHTLSSRGGRRSGLRDEQKRHPKVHQRKKKCTHAALANADIERARGGDFREAAECFVDAFFVDGKSNPDDREIGSLERAQASDLSKRYSNAKKGAMFIVRDDETCDLMACAGVEYRRYLGDYDYENVPEDVDRFALGSSITVPIIANLATSRKARGKGYAKALVRECEKEAKNNGFEECALIVESTNSKARSLYKKMGYRVAKTLKDQNALKMQSDGKARVVKVTTLLMRKSLLNQRQSIDLESLVVPIGAVVALYALSANDDLRDAIFGFLGTS